MLFPNELLNVDEENYIEKIYQYNNWVLGTEKVEKNSDFLNKCKKNSKGDNFTLKAIHLADGLEVSYIKFKSHSSTQIERDDLRYPYVLIIPIEYELDEKCKREHSTKGIQCSEFPTTIEADKEIKIILINLNLSFLKSHFNSAFLKSTLTSIKIDPEFEREGVILLSEYFKNIGNSLLEIFSSSFPLSKDKLQEYFLFRTLDSLFRILFISKNYNINLKNKIRYSSNDIDRIIKAREILISDLENPPNISDLAKKVSLNTSKLKAGFKEIYKDTIYGYLNNYRLDITYNYILKDGLNVTEAATLIGYSSLSKFSIAFKKKYGINPSYLLKMRQIKTTKIAV
ncbi:helix-turn-helix domain-containing protein (plasmid) [Leptospira sp. WS60.C2]